MLKYLNFQDTEYVLSDMFLGLLDKSSEKIIEINNDIETEINFDIAVFNNKIYVLSADMDANIFYIKSVQNTTLTTLFEFKIYIVDISIESNILNLTKTNSNANILSNDNTSFIEINNELFVIIISKIDNSSLTITYSLYQIIDDSTVKKISDLSTQSDLFFLSSYNNKIYSLAEPIFNVGSTIQEYTLTSETKEEQIQYSPLIQDNQINTTLLSTDTDTIKNENNTLSIKNIKLHKLDTTLLNRTYLSVSPKLDSRTYFYMAGNNQAQVMYTEEGDLYISYNYQDFSNNGNIKNILTNIDSSKTYDNLTIRKVIITTNNNYPEIDILFELPISGSEEYHGALYLLKLIVYGNSTLEFICNISKEIRLDILDVCIDLHEENGELIVFCPKENTINYDNGEVSVTINIYKKNNGVWEISDTFTSKIRIVI